jgi:hypothetical protein
MYRAGTYKSLSERASTRRRAVVRCSSGHCMHGTRALLFGMGSAAAPEKASERAKRSEKASSLRWRRRRDRTGQDGTGRNGTEGLPVLHVLVLVLCIMILVLDASRESSLVPVLRRRVLADDAREHGKECAQPEDAGGGQLVLTCTLALAGRLLGRCQPARSGGSNTATSRWRLHSPQSSMTHG